MCRLRIEFANLFLWISQVWYRIIVLCQHCFEHNILKFELWGSYCLRPLHVSVFYNCMSKRCVCVFVFLKLFQLSWRVVSVWEANSDFYISHLVSRWVPVWQFLVGRCARFLTHHLPLFVHPSRCMLCFVFAMFWVFSLNHPEGGCNIDFGIFVLRFEFLLHLNMLLMVRRWFGFCLFWTTAVFVIWLWSVCPRCSFWWSTVITTGSHLLKVCFFVVFQCNFGVCDVHVVIVRHFVLCLDRNGFGIPNVLFLDVQGHGPCFRWCGFPFCFSFELACVCARRVHLVFICLGLECS